MRQLPVTNGEIRDQIEAFLEGIAAGFHYGLDRLPFEFLLFRTDPHPWDAADALALVKFLSFVLASNWTSELVRLRLLLDDGADALRALDPLFVEPVPMLPQQVERVKQWVTQLTSDLDQFARILSTGASNNWVIAGSRTKSGRPLLANDPHWSPLLPSFWYLAHVETPNWALAGATLIGTPAFLTGHNGFAAWGVTAGLSDNTDLILEELGPDGTSVREGEHFVRCTLHNEAIHIRGRGAVNDLVVETRRGPIISPALRQVPWALSLRAVWLDPLPVQGLLAMHRVRSFQDLEAVFTEWPHLPLNIVYADCSGTIGWLLAGTVPRRRGTSGLFPTLGWETPDPWIDYLPATALPRVVNPPEGFFASANNPPPLSDPSLSVGADYLDSFRLLRITSELARRSDWDLDAVLNLQLDVYSLPWEAFRSHLGHLCPSSPLAQAARQLLQEWDGFLTAQSAAATIFELLVHRLCQIIAQAYAPTGWRWAIGAGFHDLTGGTNWGVRRIAHLLRSLTLDPPERLGDDWGEILSRTFEEVAEELMRHYGADPRNWAWGKARPLWLTHPLAVAPLLKQILNRGPFAVGGDANTVNAAGVSAHDPLGPVEFISSLRFAVELGQWDQARVILAGGQSGHPFSPHYDDLLALWLEGKTIPLAWSTSVVERLTVSRLELCPPGWT